MTYLNNIDLQAVFEPLSTSRNSFVYLNKEKFLNRSAALLCEKGQVIVANILDDSYRLSHQSVDEVNKVCSSIISMKNSQINIEFAKHCVVKNNIVKKIHLDNLDCSSLPSQQQLCLESIINISDYMKGCIAKLLDYPKIHSIQTILYPSTSVGRYLHFDRHDKYRKNQDCRSIKAFMNICPFSHRIWGIGPNRSSLAKKLNQICLSKNWKKINYQEILESSFVFPEWFPLHSIDKKLNHPVSMFNDFLNKQFLERIDLSGDFDVVYFQPFDMLIVDSKQVSHKPMYGELGLSVDVVYDKKEKIVSN